VNKLHAETILLNLDSNGASSALRLIMASADSRSAAGALASGFSGQWSGNMQGFQQ
jgi:hypothetical protein